MMEVTFEYTDTQVIETRKTTTILISKYGHEFTKWVHECNGNRLSSTQLEFINAIYTCETTKEFTSIMSNSGGYEVKTREAFTRLRKHLCSNIPPLEIGKVPRNGKYPIVRDFVIKSIEILFEEWKKDNQNNV